MRIIQNDGILRWIVNASIQIRSAHVAQTDATSAVPGKIPPWNDSRLYPFGQDEPWRDSADNGLRKRPTIPIFPQIFQVRGVASEIPRKGVPESTGTHEIKTVIKR